MYFSYRRFIPLLISLAACSAPAPTAIDPVSESKRPPAAAYYEITQGARGAVTLDLPAPTGKARGAHGNRFGCAVSHFSYDDPIIFPGQPGKAHLHQFTGNTTADAFSTAESLDSATRSSCQSGINNRSSYWSPAFFNEEGEAVLPELNVFYYKTFLHGKTPKIIQPGLIRPIPNGFRMLARTDTKNATPNAFSVFEKKDWSAEGKSVTGAKISFPPCIALGEQGEPVLDYRDMPAALGEQVNSHVAYPDGSAPDAQANGCPASHPYRIPTLVLLMYYDIPFDSGWYLASDDKARVQLPKSDPNHLPSGHSLHADYFAMWDETTMDRIVECNRIGESCRFEGYPEEMLYNSEGVKVYSHPNTLLPETDRTPFGDTLPQTRGGMHMTDHSGAQHGVSHDKMGHARSSPGE